MIDTERKPGEKHRPAPTALTDSETSTMLVAACCAAFDAAWMLESHRIISHWTSCYRVPRDLILGAYLNNGIRADNTEEALHAAYILGKCKAEKIQLAAAAVPDEELSYVTNLPLTVVVPKNDDGSPSPVRFLDEYGFVCRTKDVHVCSLQVADLSTLYMNRWFREIMGEEKRIGGDGRIEIDEPRRRVLVVGEPPRFMMSDFYYYHGEVVPPPNTPVGSGH